MRQFSRGVGIGLLALFAAITLAEPAAADTIDLTTAGATGTDGVAIFQQVGFQPSGTGFIDSFVRLRTNSGIEQGYNTGARPVQFDANSSPSFTRNLLLSEVPVVNLNGVNYRQFLLDINQTSANPLLSLDKLQIFQSNTADLNNYPNLGTKVYDLDATKDNFIKLDYSLNSGSGSGDMFAYIPDSLFDPNQKFVYLYSLFGTEFPNNDGFEEWSVLKGQTPPVNEIPAPATLVFGALSCGAGLVGYLRRRKPVVA
jgi:hypothetical protein